jgi:preprotein translocase subunit SecA
LIRQIRARLGPLADASDERLRELGLSLRFRASSGARIRSLIAEAFPLVIETARRKLGQTHFDEQILGGIYLAHNRIVEMKTGEGKTLTATLPAFLYGLSGRGVHVVTVNDYLAQRDRDTMGPIYETLGLSVGVIQTDHSPQQRVAAYRRDITYATAKEIGFDFLRDRLAIARTRNQVAAGAATVLRPFHYALVDEADSILIDEARTPLIIGMMDPAGEELQRECYQWSTLAAPRFVENEHFQYEHDKRQIKLTSSGWKLLRDLPQNSATRSIGIRSLQDYVETAIKARRDFHLDKHYAVVDGKIVIIDEFTGRPAEGRQWQKGLHQAIESKESVGVTATTRQAATVTVQALFKLYPHFSGMTGTAWTSRAEFRKVYRRRVARVPTHRPVDRAALPVRILPNAAAKFAAVVEETQQILSQGRAVLIGTRSVDKSEVLSRMLHELGVVHQVLNARHLGREADIVAAAGQPGRVTVATNMAGRGTDIKLHEDVRKAGGLHVILTEIHEAQRVDWQMIGRGSRQGDPGSFRIFVSLDDEILLLGLGPKKSQRLARWGERLDRAPRSAWRWFRRAQRRLERRYLVDRMILMEHDKQRRQMFFDTGQDPYLDIPE